MFRKWRQQMMENDALLIRCYFMVGTGTWNIWAGLIKMFSQCWMENKKSGDEFGPGMKWWFSNTSFNEYLPVLVPITDLSSCQTLKDLNNNESWNHNAITLKSSWYIL